MPASQVAFDLYGACQVEEGDWAALRHCPHLREGNNSHAGLELRSFGGIPLQASACYAPATTAEVPASKQTPAGPSRAEPRTSKKTMLSENTSASGSNLL